MLAIILANAAVYGGIAAGIMLLIIIIAVVARGKSGGEPIEDKKPDEPKPEPAAEKEDAKEPEPEAKQQPEPEASPAPEPESPKTENKPEPAKPPTLEVEALSPSATGEAPMLGAETGEMKMATDELPKMGTAEMPQLADAEPAQYRTQAAKDLSKAIETGDCPKCKAPTFVGSEDPQEVGADGIAMFKLTGRCGACGHRAELIDMKA